MSAKQPVSAVSEPTPKPVSEAEAVLVEVIDAWEEQHLSLDQEFNCSEKEDRQSQDEREQRRREWITRFRAAVADA